MGGHQSMARHAVAMSPSTNHTGARAFQRQYGPCWWSARHTTYTRAFQSLLWR